MTADRVQKIAEQVRQAESLGLKLHSPLEEPGVALADQLGNIASEDEADLMNTALIDQALSALQSPDPSYLEAVTAAQQAFAPHRSDQGGAALQDVVRNNFVGLHALIGNCCAPTEWADEARRALMHAYAYCVQAINSPKTGY